MRSLTSWADKDIVEKYTVSRNARSGQKSLNASATVGVAHCALDVAASSRNCGRSRHQRLRQTFDAHAFENNHRRVRPNAGKMAGKGHLAPP